MIAVIGENIVDLIGQRDGTFMPYLGGSPFNVAIGLGKLEQPCCYLSPISSDAFGAKFLALLAANNVNYGLPARSPCQSSITLITLDGKGYADYSIYRHGVADRDICATQLIAALPQTLRILHTGSLALDPSDLPNLIPVIKFAKQKGAKISVDLNVRMETISNSAAFILGVEALLPLCNYVKASDQDLLSLFPKLDRDDAISKIIAAMDDGIFAFTEGEFGASLITRTQHIFLPALKPPLLADTIGAGDTFYAALLASIMDKQLDKIAPADIKLQQLNNLLRRSIVAATISLSRSGCVPPSKAELTEHIEHVGDVGLDALDQMSRKNDA